MSAQSTRGILLDAADHCDETGLHKGELWPGESDCRLYTEGDPCCAEGHIRVVAGIETGRLLEGPAAAALLRLSAHVHCVVERWNDVSHRTAAEVADALRAAAERAT